ncbi:hypothetical protein KAJ27_04055 [bacterium]|nr:hypothetical protein [bacterium]
MKNLLILFLFFLLSSSMLMTQQESTEASIEIPEIDKIQPLDNTETNPGSIEFLWNTINPLEFDSSSGFITYAIEIHKLQDNSWFLLKRRVVSPQSGNNQVSFVFTLPEGTYKWTVRAIYGMFIKDSRPKLVPGPPGDYYNFFIEITENENQAENQQNQINNQKELQLVKVNVQKAYNNCISKNWSIQSQMSYLKAIDEAIEVFNRIIPNGVETGKIKGMWTQTKIYILTHCEQRVHSMKNFCKNNNWTLKVQTDYLSLLKTVFEVYLELIPEDKKTSILKYRIKKISRELKKLGIAERNISRIDIQTPSNPLPSNIIPPVLPKAAITIPKF